jgi:hypothetical protein
VKESNYMPGDCHNLVIVLVYTYTGRKYDYIKNVLIFPKKKFDEVVT